MLTLLLTALLGLSADAPSLPENMRLLRHYQSPEAPALPGSIDYSENGRLYLLDQRNGTVMIWNADGSYHKSFGKQDLAEGEMRNPIVLATSEKGVWVWARNQRIYVFDLEGNYQRNIHYQGAYPKALGVLNEKMLLMGTGRMQEGKLEAHLLLGLPEGKVVEMISFPNPMLLGTIEGTPPKMAIRGFGPDMDIQRNENGNWYMGFADIPFLFRLDTEGRIIGQIPVDLPQEPVSEDEKNYARGADFPVWSGQRIKLEDDQTQLNFRDNKAAYTQFTLKNGKGIFVLTATGGYITDVYPASSRASYKIVDMRANQIVGTGSYQLPKDSQVHYRNGRIVAAIKKGDSYQIVEVGIEGF